MSESFDIYHQTEKDFDRTLVTILWLEDLTRQKIEIERGIC